MTTHPRRAAALLAALGILLAGCSSTGAPDPTASPSTEHWGPLSEYLAPVDEALGGEGAGLALNTEMQESVAACMVEAGFDYVPYVTPDLILIDVPDKDTRDWVARRGYGLSGGLVEGPELEAMLASDAANAAQPASVDPNEAIYAQLSEGTKAAYDLALNGPPYVDGEERDEAASWTIADGCYTWASIQQAERSAAYFADYADLQERMRAVRSTVDTRPRMVELTTEWAHCMADAGHVYTSPTHAWESVYAVIHGSPGPDGDPYVTSDEAKALEITVALADYDCKEDLRWDEVRNSVTDEVEAQFLEDNKAEIDEYIDYVLQTAADRR